MKHSNLLFVFRTLIASLGSCGAPKKCALWKGVCKNCSKHLEFTQGIFCANFFLFLNGFTPFQSPLINFHKNVLKKDPEKEGEDRERIEAWREKIEKDNDFDIGRMGDHLLYLF